MADAALSANVSLLGSLIEGSEIADGTIEEVDLEITNAGGPGVDNYVLTYDDATGGFTWVDPATVGTTGNAFTTIDVPSGTDPTATSATDTLTILNGAGITVTGGGSNQITITSTLGTAIDTSEITNDTILAVDLDNTTAPTVTEDGYILSYDNATGGFTWIDPSGVGTPLTEAQVEAYIFDGDNTGTLTSGTIALDSV